MKMYEIKKVSCAFCGKTLTARQGKRYCSDECKAAMARERMEEATCPVCGKAFLRLPQAPYSSQPVRKYCSRPCANKGRLRHRIVEKTCEVCGKPLRGYKDIDCVPLCSKRCRYAFKAMQRQKRQAPRKMAPYHFAQTAMAGAPANPIAVEVRFGEKPAARPRAVLRAVRLPEPPLAPTKGFRGLPLAPEPGIYRMV